MTTLLERALRETGPCLSTELARVLVETHGLTKVAARQRVSRLGANIARLENLHFPRNARFVYLIKTFGSPEYWSGLIKALLTTNSAYGLALSALRVRKGIIPKYHFHIACGAPLRQLKHLSPETIFHKLQQVKLVDEYSIPGIGTCVALIQGEDRYDSVASELRARLITEDILLAAVKMWIRRLGLGSYDRVTIRDKTNNFPTVSTFAWDLTVPSYLAPMLNRGHASKAKPGFIVCDVLLGTEVDKDGLLPFLNKCTTLRSLKNVGRCLQIFVADRYSNDAFLLAKQNGIVPATPETLFGTEVAEGLIQLTSVLREAVNFAIELEKFDDVFARLGKIEGAANNLRGALFEFIAAEVARKTISTHILMNTIIKNEDGGKAEVDVIAEKLHQSVHFIECKGYQPYGTIPDTYVERWLQKLSLIYQHTRSHSVWKNLAVNFEFWTTGKLSPAAILMIQETQRKVRKYSVNYREAAAFQALVKETGDVGLHKTVEQHFLTHPLAKVNGRVDKRTRNFTHLQDYNVDDDEIFEDIS